MSVAAQHQGHSGRPAGRWHLGQVPEVMTVLDVSSFRGRARHAYGDSGPVSVPDHYIVYFIPEGARPSLSMSSLSAQDRGAWIQIEVDRSDPEQARRMAYRAYEVLSETELELAMGGARREQASQRREELVRELERFVVPGVRAMRLGKGSQP